MKLKTKVKALTLAVSIAMAGTASAKIEGLPDSLGNVGGSELVLTLFNLGSGISETYDIGFGANSLSWNSFDPTASGTYQLPSNLTTSILNDAGTTWNVMAADNSQAGAVALDLVSANWGTRVMTTFKNDVVLKKGSIIQPTAFAGDYITGINTEQLGHQGAANAEGFQTGITGGGGWWGLQMNTAFMPKLNVNAAVGETVGFQLASDVYTVSEVVPGLVVDAVLTGITQQKMGTWNLSSQGALTYSAVPIPAAVWLLGSALMGLVGVARRRTSVA